MKAVADLCLEIGAIDVYIVDTEERKKAVWSARGAFLEAIKSSTTEMDECDVVVPVNKVDEFIKFTHSLSEEMNVRIPSFGHAGDGNLHIYICRDALDDSKWETVLKVCFDRMYSKAESLGGLVSGEHGISIRGSTPVCLSSCVSIRTRQNQVKYPFFFVVGLEIRQYSCDLPPRKTIYFILILVRRIFGAVFLRQREAKTELMLTHLRVF